MSIASRLNRIEKMGVAPCRVCGRYARASHEPPRWLDALDEPLLKDMMAFFESCTHHRCPGCSLLQEDADLVHDPEYRKLASRMIPQWRDAGDHDFADAWAAELRDTGGDQPVQA